MGNGETSPLFEINELFIQFQLFKQEHDKDHKKLNKLSQELRNMTQMQFQEKTRTDQLEDETLQQFQELSQNTKSLTK
jgi:hypothetical protein